MMKDRFDRILAILLLCTFAGLGYLLATGAGGAGNAHSAGLNRAMEREMAHQARVALLQKLYGPVEELRREGQPQAALLKLDELSRRYPGEAHGHILKGEILLEMGALQEAVTNFTAGVRLSGDYVDQRNPLSRRMEIRRLVDEGLVQIGERARANPDNPGPVRAMRDLYYLQSRLAGGCE